MTIQGDWRTRRVLVDGRELLPDRSLEVWNHSPTGFNWGYAGSGPAQLALALLLEAGVTPHKARVLHQRFKADWLTWLPQGDFVTVIDIAAWVARIEAERS